MGKILVIEDDRNIQVLLEKILPRDKHNLIRTAPDEDGSPEDSSLPSFHGPSPQTLEESVRTFLREEVKRNSRGAIHGAVIARIEKILIGMILEEEKGNQVRTAKRLGINRNTLRKKMKALGIITRVITGLGEN